MCYRRSRILSKGQFFAAAVSYFVIILTLFCREIDGGLNSDIIEQNIYDRMQRDASYLASNKKQSVLEFFR
jgi:hypothetical protein